MKSRLKRLLIYSITGAVVMSLGMSMAGAASLFFLIGFAKKAAAYRTVFSQNKNPSMVALV